MASVAMESSHRQPFSHLGSQWLQNPTLSQPTPFPVFPRPATRRRKYEEISDDSSDSSPSDTPRISLRTASTSPNPTNLETTDNIEMESVSFTPYSKRPRIDQTSYFIPDPPSKFSTQSIGEETMDAGGGRHDFTWPPSTATSPPSRHKRHRDDDDDVQGLEGLEIRTGTDLDTTLSMSGGGQRTDPAFGFPSPPRSAKRIRKTGSSSSQMAGSLASGGVIIEDVSYDDWANGRPTTQGVVTSPSGSPTSRLRGNTSEINLEPARVVELNDEARDPQQAYPTQYFPSTFSVPPSLPFSVPFEQIHPPTPPPTISPSAIRPLGKVQFDTSAFESDSADACTSLVPIARRPPSPTPSVLCIDPILNDAWRARRRQWDFGDRRPVVPGFGLDMGPRRGSEVILFRSSAPEAQSQDAIEEWERIPDERIQEVTDIEDVGGTSSVDRDGMVTESGTDEDQRSDSASAMDLDF